MIDTTRTSPVDLHVFYKPVSEAATRSAATIGDMRAIAILALPDYVTSFARRFNAQNVSREFYAANYRSVHEVERESCAISPSYISKDHDNGQCHRADGSQP